MQSTANELSVGELNSQPAQQLFREHQQLIYERTDRMFAGLMALQWLAAIAITIWISPKTWAGASSQIHPHVWAVLLLGGVISAFPMVLGLTRAGATSTRYVMAVGQMLMGALLIHLTGGRIETHFHVFGSLAFLAFYRDWRVLVPATLVVVGDHLLRGLLWPQSLYGVLSATVWRTIEHAGWVVFEDVFLVISCLRSQRDMWSKAVQSASQDASEQRYRQLADAMPQIVWTATPDGSVDYYNQRWFDYTGMTFEQTEGWRWGPVLHPDDLQKCINGWGEAIRTGQTYQIDSRIKDGADGEYRWHLVRAVPVRDTEKRIIKWYGTCTDIDDKKRVEDALLTAREELEERVEERTVADILRGTFRDSDVIARFGGDEFVILLEDASTAVMDKITCRLWENLRTYNEQASHSYVLSLSIGVVCFDPNTGSSIDELIAMADEAMYAQKRLKKKSSALEDVIAGGQSGNVVRNICPR